MNEKMIKIIGVVSSCFVVFLLVLFLISSCNKKTYTYNQYQDKLLNAGKSHFQSNESALPKEDRQEVTIDLEQLIKEKRIEKPEKAINSEATCQGYVKVTNNNGTMLYSPYLNCGENYKTTYLVDKIKENTVTQGVGLYKSDDTYIMRGEVKNNFLKINDSLYRIIKVNKDNSIRVVELDSIQNAVWDNRYNSEIGYSDGINEYIINSIDSRIKETLANYYKNMNESLKSIIQMQDLCIGKRTVNDTTTDGSTECQTKLGNQPLSTLYIYEYLQASLDPSCTSINSYECNNYNWMTTSKINSWTITGNAEKSNKAYYIKYGINSASCNNYRNINVTFDITGQVMFAGGDGTETNPYTIY